MNFHEELLRHRESQNLSQEDAAHRLHLSVRAYRDYETGRTSANFPLRFGLLVGLGMESKRAAEIADRPDIFDFASPSQVEASNQAASDPFVWEESDSFIFSIRTTNEKKYRVEKERVRSAEEIIGWVAHLSEKAWVTSEQLNIFVNIASKHLGLSIHKF